MGGSILEEYANLPGFEGLSASGFFDTSPEDYWDIVPTVTKVDKIAPEDRLAFEPQMVEESDEKESKRNNLKEKSSKRRSMDRRARSESVDETGVEISTERQHQAQGDAQGKEAKKNSLRKRRSRSVGALKDGRKVEVSETRKEPKNPKTPRSKKKASKPSALAQLCLDSIGTEDDNETRRRSHGLRTSSEVVDVMSASEATGRERLTKRHSSERHMPVSETLSTLMSAIPAQTEITSLSISESGPNLIRLTLKYSPTQGLVAIEEKPSADPKPGRRKTVGSEVRKRLAPKSSSGRNLVTLMDDSQVRPKRKSSRASMSVSDGGATRTRLARQEEPSKQSSGLAPPSLDEDSQVKSKSKSSRSSMSVSEGGTRARLGKEEESSLPPKRGSETPRTRKSRLGRKSLGGMVPLPLDPINESPKKQSKELETPSTRKSRLTKKRVSEGQGMPALQPIPALQQIQEPVTENDITEPKTPRSGKGRVLQNSSSPSQRLGADMFVPPLDWGNEKGFGEGGREGTRKSKLTKKKSNSMRSLSTDMTDKSSSHRTEPRKSKPRESKHTKSGSEMVRSSSLHDVFVSRGGLEGKDGGKEGTRKSKLIKKKSNSMRSLSTNMTDEWFSRNSESSAPKPRDSKHTKNGMTRSSSLRDVFGSRGGWEDKPGLTLFESGGSKSSRRAANKRAGSLKSLSLDEALEPFTSTKLASLKSSASVSEGLLKEKTGRSMRSDPENARRLNSLIRSGEVRTNTAKRDIPESPRNRRERLLATTMAPPTLQSFLDTPARHSHRNATTRKSRCPPSSRTTLSLADTIANTSVHSLASTITNSCGVSLASTIANSTGVSLADTIFPDSPFSHIDSDEITTTGSSVSYDVSRLGQGGRRRRHSAGFGPGHDALAHTLNQYSQHAPLVPTRHASKSTDMFSNDSKHSVWVHRRLRALGIDAPSDRGSVSTT